MDWAGLLAAGLQGWGMIQQNKLANKMYKLQLRDYEDEKERKKTTTGRMNTAAANTLGGGTFHKYDALSAASY